MLVSLARTLPPSPGDRPPSHRPPAVASVVSSGVGVVTRPSERCRALATFAVQNGRQPWAYGPHTGAINAAGASWPFRNERKAPAHHTETAAPHPPAGAHRRPSSLCHPPVRLGGPALSWWQQSRKQSINTGRVPPRRYSSPFPKPSLAGFLRYTSCAAIQLRRQALPFQDLLCGVLYPRAVPAAFGVLLKAKTVGRLLWSLGHGP